MGIGADGSASGVNRRVAEIRSEAAGEGDVRRESLTASRKTFTAGDAPANSGTIKKPEAASSRGELAERGSEGGDGEEKRESDLAAEAISCGVFSTTFSHDRVAISADVDRCEATEKAAGGVEGGASEGVSVTRAGRATRMPQRWSEG